MVERLTALGTEHWAVVGLNALLCSLMAALLASLVVFIGGAALGFVRIYRDQRFRHPQFISSFWAFLWLVSILGNVVEWLRPRSVGGLKAYELLAVPSHAELRHCVAVFVHGTYGAAQNYDWQRWSGIAGAFESKQWQILRFAWSGGNSSRAREIAAQRLAEHVCRLRSEQADRVIVLVGHSHGGTVCEDVARRARVDGVIAIASPHTGTTGTPQDNAIVLGVFVRALGPIFLAGAFVILGFWALLGGHQLASSTTLIQLWSWGGVAILCILFWRLFTGHSELKRCLRAAEEPLKGTPQFLCIRTTNDFVLQEAETLQERVAAIAIFTAEMAQKQAQDHARARGLMKWLREIFGFSIFGTLLIIVGAGVLTVTDIPNEWRDVMTPWFFPTINALGGKYLIYAFALTVPYGLLRLAIGREPLPRWHRGAFRLGTIVAFATRMSQLYSFKAGLLGMRALALHVKDLPIVAAPYKAAVKTVMPPAGTTSVMEHVVVLILPGTASAIKSFVSRFEGSPSPVPI